MLQQREIENYLAKYPKTQGVSRDIFENYHLSDEELSAKFNRSLSVIKRFRKLNLRWMNQRLNKSSNVPKRKRKKVGQKAVLKAKQPFRRGNKDLVHKCIIDTFRHRSIPSGIIPTLPLTFDLEMKLIKIHPGIKFMGFETAVHPSDTRKSKMIQKWQSSFLKRKPSLRSKLLMFNSDINDYVNFQGPESLASVFLDYCGTYRINRKTIEHAIRNLVVKRDGLIWVSVNSRADKNCKVKLLKLISDAKAIGYSLLYSDFHEKKVKGDLGAPTYTFVLRRDV